MLTFVHDIYSSLCSVKLWWKLSLLGREVNLVKTKRETDNMNPIYNYFDICYPVLNPKFITLLCNKAFWLDVTT